MRNVRVDVFCNLILALLFLAPFCYAAENVTNVRKPCDMTKPEDQCGKNERCYEVSKGTSQCRCLIGYQLVGDACVQIAVTTVASITTDQPDIKENSGGSSVAAGLLIPTFLVVIGVLLYFGARRYKWVQRFRQLRPNHYGNVLVTRDDDDDDDDPPIA